MKIKILILVLFLTTRISIASDDHDHDKPKSKIQEEHKEHAGEDGHDHEHEAEAEHAKEDEHGHEHGENHDEHEEENPQVGADKGILEASEDKGIKLAPEAEKNFEIKRLRVDSLGSITLPKSAIVTAGTEMNLLRYRDGFYKRIDFVLISKTSDKRVVTSKDLKLGDEITLTGLGFLRIAEIAAFGGAPEGHSH